MNAKNVFEINPKYDSKTNKYELLNSKPENFKLQHFKDIKSAFDEIVKLDFSIYVIITDSLYQSYYSKLQELKGKISCCPITIILLEDPNNKKIYDIIEDKKYNLGKICKNINEVLQYLGVELNSNTEEKKFHLEIIADNFENIILPCLYSKSKTRDFLINDLDNDIYKFNVKLKEEHKDEKLCKEIDSYLKVEKIYIEFITKFWIRYLTSNNTFYKTINKEFMENNYSNYKIFIKALYRGLNKKYLKSKFDVPLYHGCFIPKDDFNSLKYNLNNSKKQLIYSRQLLFFHKDIKSSLNFLSKKEDENLIPVLFETDISENDEPFSSNVDIEKYSENPNEKEVIFLPYSCFIIEENNIKEGDSGGIKYKIIKLNYLGNNPERINKAMYEVNEEKITTLLNNNSYSFSKDIVNKFENEFPDKEKFALIKSLDIEAKLIKENCKYIENNEYQKNVIEIKMATKGNFIGDEYFNYYHWMMDIYYDNILQDELKNKINNRLPEKIKIVIKYPLLDCEKMFYSCNNISEINFVNIDTSKVTNMKEMFSRCLSLKEIKNIDKFDTTNITNMSCMFYKCLSLIKLDLSKFKIDCVNDMSAMFMFCINLKDLNFDLSNIKLDILKDISFMFRFCQNLENYDISKCQLEKVEFNEGYI